MIDFLLLPTTILLGVVDFIAAIVYSEGIELLLQKNRLWFRPIMLWVGILLLQTAVFTWLPGHVGVQITMLEGLIVFEDGALIKNLCILLYTHAASIAILLCKYLWNVICKKTLFNPKFFLLELVVCFVLCIIATRLLFGNHLIYSGGGDTTDPMVLWIFAVVGAGIVIWFILTNQSK